MPPIEWKDVFGEARVSVAVEGVRLGDPVDALPFARFTAVEPRAERRRRIWRGSDAFDVGEDGSETPVTRESLEAELRREGGSAWIDRVGFDIADGAVRKIWVRGAASLDGVPIAAEADIAERLGAPTGIERILGWRVYHYADRGLSIGWDPKRVCVEHVALGPVDWSAPIFGRDDVLSYWIEAALVLPSWDEPADRGSSAWVRWARATALLSAFELGDPKAFAHGRFLDGKSLERYPRAAAAIATHWPRPLEVSSERSPLPELFWWLLVYRTDATRVMRLNSGWLEAGQPGILTAIEVTNGVTRALGDALEPVDALLGELISPDDRKIDEAELVSRWGWPEVDLQALLDEEDGI